MNEPTIKATFSPDLNTATVTIALGATAHTYHNLIVKKINLSDWKKPEFIYLVKIPCAKALGQDYMCSFGRDAIYGYVHPERQPFIFQPYADDDAIEPVDNKPKQLSFLEGE